MAEHVDSRIVLPTVPSLFHLALVKVSIPLFYKHGSNMLNFAMADIHLVNLAAFNEGIGEKRVVNNSRAKEAFLYIPAHLRKSVLEAVNGIQNEVDRWRTDHISIFDNGEIESLVENVFSWRCDGSIDRIKTAEELVLNENFTVSMRFKIACKYSFIKSVTTLWEEIVASGKAENYGGANDSIENVWINWIRDGTPTNWIQALLEQKFVHPQPRFSSFFPLLHPDDRKKALANLYRFDVDDVRFCLYAMTNKEQEEFTMREVQKLLQMFSNWPLQNLFLKITEKVKNYIAYNNFYFIEHSLWLQRSEADFDYTKLIKGFWNIIPETLKKKILEETPDYQDSIIRYLRMDKRPKILCRGRHKRLCM